MDRDYTSYTPNTSTTPWSLKFIIGLIIGLSLTNGLFNGLFPNLPYWARLDTLFSLSLHFFQEGMFWQPITYVLIQPSPNGLDFSSLLNLLFNTYLIWIGSSLLLQLISRKTFYTFCSIQILLTGLSVCLFQIITQDTSTFASPFFIALGCISVWAFAHADSEIKLFFVFKMKAKWIIAIFFIFNLIVPLSQQQFAYSLAVGSTLILSYLSYLVMFRTTSFLSFLHPIESLILYLLKQREEKKRLHLTSVKQSESIIASKSKKYDFGSGKAIVDDDVFVDAMLDKINQYGEHSLTNKEKRKLNKISKKKRMKL